MSGTTHMNVPNVDLNKLKDLEDLYIQKLENN